MLNAITNITNSITNLFRFKGKSKYVIAENYSIIGIVAGAFILSFGIGSTILSPQGVPAIISMLGALISFLSTVALIFVWLLKEFFVKEEDSTQST
jgi:hypothetical protein